MQRRMKRGGDVYMMQRRGGGVCDAIQKARAKVDSVEEATNLIRPRILAFVFDNKHARLAIFRIQRHGNL